MTILALAAIPGKFAPHPEELQAFPGGNKLKQRAAIASFLLQRHHSPPSYREGRREALLHRGYPR